MFQTFAAVDTAVLMSLYKPILVLITAGGWAWVVSRLDKDLEALYLPRQLWNGAQIAAAALAFGLWLIIPFFWLGFFLALIILVGAILGYVFYRNTQVDPSLQWTASLATFTQKIEAVQAQQARRAATVHLLTPDGQQLEVPVGADNPIAAAHSQLEALLDFALPRKADRIDVMVSTDQQVGTVIHVDGFKHPHQGLDARTAVALIDYIKTNAGMDVEDRRRKQTGVLNIDAGELGRHVLAVAASGSTRELAMSLRIDADLRASVGLVKLGLLEPQRESLRKVLAGKTRAVLITAPQHQGMTTTLYSFLHEHDPYTQSIVTFEDEIAFEVEGVNHNLVPPGADGKAVAEKFQILLRQDPGVAMISKVTDPQVVKMIATGARETRIYAGLRQDDTFTVLKVWMKTVGDARQAAESLSAITAQRLVRRLCTTCRTPYKPDPDALRKLNLPADKTLTLYKQSGQVMVKGKPQVCPGCLGVAYRGRIGVFEVMVLDDQARVLVAQNQIDQLRTHLRKGRMLWLQEAAMARVIDGTTSVAEVRRVLEGK
ncbi:MAG: ATPase, T2SS/T4P/T4SS family [Phycisphaeraceae bacterium]